MTYYSPWKAVHHPERLAAIRAGRPVPPANIQIDLEGYCPHSCVFCSYRNADWQAHGMVFSPPTRPSSTSGLPRELALDLVSQLPALGTQAIEITGGGEPLASPYIADFLRAVASANISIALVTNGMYLTRALSDLIVEAAWVRISLDAATPATYSTVHGVSEQMFQRVVNNAKAFIAARSPACKVGASYVITSRNLSEIVQAATLCQMLGFDNIRYAMVYEPSGSGWLTEEEKIRAMHFIERARQMQAGQFQVFGTSYRLDYYSRPNVDFDACHSQRFVWAIGCDGLVYPCCIMKYHNDFAIGDLRKQTLSEIAEQQAASVKQFDVRKCKPCWLRDKNQFIGYLLEEKPPHVNYV